MKPWEIAGIVAAVAIGSAVGGAYMVADLLNRYILQDEPRP